MTISNFLYGVLAIALGVVAIRYNYQLVRMTGNVGVFEKFLGGGGTYAGFKLIAIILIIGGILTATGLGGNVAELLFSPLRQLFPFGKS